MRDWFDFFLFQDPNIIIVTLGAILLTSSSATVGVFTFLKKKALIGDVISHAVLPGVCLAFMLTGNKNPVVILMGAFVTGWFSVLSVDWIAERSKIKEDTAIAIVLSVFFGLGILLLTRIQQTGNAAQTGLQSFLFGKAAALSIQDVYTFGTVAIVLFVSILVFFKELQIISFDQDYAIALGLPVKLINFILSTLTVLAVVTGIQAVGVVLMAAILIAPASAARFWTDDIRMLTGIAAILGGFAGLSGAFISYTAPAMPTGPWIVLVLFVIAIFSFLFAPKRGVVSRELSLAIQKRKILAENVLKELYRLGERQDNEFKALSTQDLLTLREFPMNTLKPTLHRLKRTGDLSYKNEQWQLTEKGIQHGQRIVKLHRLWEMYLSTFLRIQPDHVHEDAETIEHILTPELEKQLEQILDYPEVDPHDKKIPY